MSDEPVPADRLARALRELVADGTLTGAQAASVAARAGLDGSSAPATAPPRAGAALLEVAGYLGAALVAGGVALVVVPTWDELAYAVRLVLAATVTLLLGAGAVMVAGAAPPWRRGGRASDGVAAPLPARARLASTLAALAAGGAGVTAAVAASTRYEVLAGSVAALAVAALGYVLLGGAPVLVAVAVASVTALAAGLDELSVSSEGWWATWFALLGAGWLTVAVLGPRVGVRREQGVAGLVGGLIGLGAGELAAVDSADPVALYGLVLGLGVVAACFGAYLLVRRWALLVPAVLTALVVPATALANLLDSSLAAGVAVAVAGLAVLAAGGVALLRRDGGRR